MTAAIVVRSCDAIEEFHACVQLQREIWGEDELEVEPATLFVVAAHTGGEGLGGFEGGKFVGLNLGLSRVCHRGALLPPPITSGFCTFPVRAGGRAPELFQREEAV